MFSKRYEQELAEIKAMTQQLGERLQVVVERVERIVEDQEGRSPRSALETNEGPKASEQVPASRRSSRGAGDGGSLEYKGPKAAKRARAAQAEASRTEAVKSDFEPAAEAALVAEPRKRGHTDRPKKAKKAARAGRQAGGQTSAASVGRDETAVGEAEPAEAASGEQGGDGDVPNAAQADGTASSMPAGNQQPPGNTASTPDSKGD
jgi:hypothetical protein